MTPQEHKERHQMLHRYLDELVADWITHTQKRPSQATVLELMKWSAQQTQNPTDHEWNQEHPDQKENPAI